MSTQVILVTIRNRKNCDPRSKRGPRRGFKVDIGKMYLKSRSTAPEMPIFTKKVCLYIGYINCKKKCDIRNKAGAQAGFKIYQRNIKEECFKIFSRTTAPVMLILTQRLENIVKF